MAKKDDEQRTLRKYMDRIEAAEKWRDSGYKDLWNRCYKRWRNRVDKLYDSKGKEIKDRSSISIPYTFVQVETILPRLVETLFAARPYITVKGNKPQAEQNAENMETLLDWQMNERMDIQDIFHSGLKTLCIYGTSVAYTGWKLDERKVIKKQQVPAMIEKDGVKIPVTDTKTGQPVMDWKPQEVNEVTYDDPEVRFIDLGLFYVDSNATDIDSARYCGHVAYETKEFIQSMTDKGWKVDWKKIPKDSKSNTARDERMGSVGLPTNSDDNQHDDENRLYEIHYYWEDNKQVVIINRSYIARDGENPFWHRKKPYVKDTYCDVPDEFYGMGVVEMIEDLQDELNTERNQRIDYRGISMRRMWKVRRGANINPEQLVWRQNGRVYVDGDDDVSLFETPDPALAGSFNQEQTVKQDMRDTSGAHDVVMGTAGNNETATSTVTKDNNASMRFKLIISSIEKKLLVGVSRQMMQLNQQFIDNDRILRVTGKTGDEYIEQTPEGIQGEFDLVAMGSSVEPMANKEAYKQRLMQLYGVIAGDPLMQQYPEKRIHLLKKIFEAFDMKDTESLLPSEDEISGQRDMKLIQQIIGTLPTELQQMILQGMQGAPPNQAPSQPPSVPNIPNEPMQQEPLHLVGGVR